MSCPHLKEVVMLFCDGYPVKKMLPLDRIASAHPCLGKFEQCPMFVELCATDGLRHGLDEAPTGEAPLTFLRRRP